jgi:hypothetical protein
MIMPSFLITFVGFLGFLIPADRGEKTGVGVTTLLSMTVFLMVIADSMPPNSDAVPLIGKLPFAASKVPEDPANSFRFPRSYLGITFLNLFLLRDLFCCMI